MKKFSFSLESLQQLRAAQEEAAQKRLAQAHAACEEVTKRLMGVTEDLRHAWDGLQHQWVAGLSATDLKHIRAWCCVLEERKTQITAELRQRERDREARRAELAAAMRRRETLERLHRKHREAYEKRARAEEQKTLDEISQRSALRFATMAGNGVHAEVA